MILDTNAISALAGFDQTLARMVDASENAALSFIAVAEYLHTLIQGCGEPASGTSSTFSATISTRSSASPTSVRAAE